MTADGILDLRARHRLATRKELSRFGIELFLRRGFAATTIDQIVEPLGIARRTFFRYFKTKEDLVFAWYEDLTAQLVEELTSRQKGAKPFEAVCGTLASLLKIYDENPDWAFAMLRLSKETPALIGKDLEKRLIWERALVAVLTERSGRHAVGSLKARVVVGTAMSAFSAALNEWYISGGKARLRSIVDKAFLLARDL